VLFVVSARTNKRHHHKLGSFYKKMKSPSEKIVAAEQAKIIYRQIPESSELGPQSILLAQRYGVDPKTIRDIWYLNLTC